MIERLKRALEHVEELPADAQDELAEQIEQYQRRPRERRRSFAGVWSELPDDMEETLLRWHAKALQLFLVTVS